MTRRVRALHVAEKPSVAKSLAATLSKNSARMRRGPSVYNALFEFETAGPRGPKSNWRFEHVVTSVTGHLMSSEFAEPYNKWQACSPRELLCEDISQVKWSVPDDKKPLKQQLEIEARNCDWLILWLDCDREGEAICYEVLNVCSAVNGRMDVWRAKFSSLNVAEVEKAWNTLGRPDERKSEAVACRTELDLRSGAAFTRLQTFRIQGRYAGLQEAGGIVSYGPCQFPTLGFIVARQNEIDAFNARNFWRIELQTKSLDAETQQPQLVNWNWRRQRLFDRVVATVLLEECVEAEDAVIEGIDARPTTKSRPLPLATLELQKRASRWLQLGSQETMEVAESLYQRGYVSYPRTETDKFSAEFDLRGLLHDHRADNRWGGHVDALLDSPNGSPASFLWPKAGQRDDEAHPPIHPTKAAGPTELTDARDKKIYELIARHFIASCSRDATGRQTTVTLSMGDEYFETKGLIVDDRNWLAVYTYERWNANSLPGFVVQQRLVPSKLELTTGATRPPSGLTESDLLSKMDAHGIGTDATMAQHIKTVMERDYARKTNQIFKPTPLGSALVDAYDDIGHRLNRPELRAALEADVASIARGVKTKAAVLKDSLVTMRKCFDDVVADVAKIDLAIRARLSGQQGAAPPSDDTIDASGFSSACGDCGGSMPLYRRGSKKRPVLRCDTCSHSLPLPLNATSFTQRTERCALCGFQAIQVTDQFQKSYAICPQCVKAPPLEAGVDTGSLRGGEMKCKDCCASDKCALAEGIVGATKYPVATCERCIKPMHLQKKADGAFYVGCSKECGAAVWLPRSVASTAVDDATCPRCAGRNRVVRKVKLKLQRAKLPPGMPLNPSICVFCDDLLDDLGLSRKKLRFAPNPQQQQQQQRQQPQQQQRQQQPQPQQQQQRQQQPQQQQQRPQQPQQQQQRQQQQQPQQQQHNRNNNANNNANNNNGGKRPRPAPPR